MTIILTVVGIVVIVLAAAAVVFWWGFRRSWDRPQPSKKDTLMPASREGVGKALVVYHPGATKYTQEVAYAIGEGLQSMNWEVHLDRANEATNSDLDSYDLLCVGSPTYASAPRPPIMTYIERCSRLEGKESAVFATGSSSPQRANAKMKEHLEKRGSKVLESLSLLVKQRKTEAHPLAKEFAVELAKMVKSE